MSTSSRAASGAAVTLVGQAVKLGVMAVSTIVLSRLLEPSDFGVIAMAMAFVGVADILRDFGLSMAAVQAKQLSQGQQSNLFWLNVLIGIALAGLLLLVAMPIQAFYADDRAGEVVRWLALSYVAAGFTAQFRVSMNRQLRFAALSVCDVAPVAVGAAGAIIAATLGAGYHALIAQQLIAAGAGLVFSAMLSKWWPGLPSRRDSVRQLVGFGSSLAFTQLLAYGTRNVDSIGLGRVWGANALGTYDRAYQLMMLPLNQVSRPLTRVALPLLARSADDMQRFQHLLRRSQLISLYLTGPLFFWVAAVGTELVPLVLGEQWREAGVVLSILAIGGAFRAISQVTYWAFMALGLARAQLVFYSIAQPLTALVILAGLPWGAIGVAIGHSVGYGLLWLASLLWLQKPARFSTALLLGDAVRALCCFSLPAAGAAFIIMLAASPLPPAARIGLAAFGAVVSFSVAALLVRSIRADLIVIAGFIRSAIRRKRA